MGLFDDIGTSAAIRELARDLKLDEGDLIAEWRRKTEALVANGIPHQDAIGKAYRAIYIEEHRKDLEKKRHQ